jgi:hypothetical protein
VVKIDGKGARFGIFLTRIEHSKKTVLYRRVQCSSFDVSYYSHTDENEMEVYIPQDEQAQLIDAWV